MSDADNFVLRSTVTSPFGRKVRMAIDMLELGDRIKLQPADPLDESDTLRQQNPLGKMPCLVLPDGGAAGVIIAQGGNIGGWSLYVKDGKLRYCYNFLGITYTYVESRNVLPAGDHQVRMEFAYDGGGPAKGGTVSLYPDGDKTGEGRVEATVPLIFSADETADVGRDTASPVSDDYDGESSVFSGTVNWVQIDLGEDAEDADHLITPEERLRVAMARQ